jgi:6-phosphogluconolactonase (cycloisomerase 2 family)
MSYPSTRAPSVYVQTNDLTRNEVLAFERLPDGGLAAARRVATGGAGTGEPHVASQGSLALSSDGAWLLVVNAGSDELSLLEVQEDGGLHLADRVGSGGAAPTSVTVHDPLVYVLNSATSSIAGFELRAGRLAALDGSSRPLSDANADGAQIAFSVDGATLVVTERATDSISAFSVDERGLAVGPHTIGSCGQTPYGFGFAAEGAMIVTEAFGAAPGAAAASSYVLTEPGRLAPVSASVANTRSEVCWAVVTSDGRFAFVTNFGDGTISSYAIAGDASIELQDPVAATTRLGEKGIRDAAITRDGRYLYAIDTDAQRVFGWSVSKAGELTAIGAFDGVPDTVAGLAAS